jgi:hypothetical protein
MKAQGKHISGQVDLNKATEIEAHRRSAIHVKNPEAEKTSNSAQRTPQMNMNPINIMGGMPISTPTAAM